MTGILLCIAFGIILAAGILALLFAERGRLVTPSSRKFLREFGLRSLFDFRNLHSYVYGRWVREYVYLLLNVILPRADPKAKRWWADRYHGKVLTLELAQAIVSVREDIPLTDLEQIIPYAMARNLVLTGPPEMAVFPCGCRQTRKNPCTPIDVCMVMGQPFVDFILEHHPNTARRIHPAEALELLQAEHDRGHVQSAWFKDATLDRFYVICNCCKCCCGGIEAMTKYGARSIAPSGYAARVEDASCDGCGACADACPFQAITVDGHAAVVWEKCMGCGVCVSRCPNQAISLIRDEGKGIPLDVRLMVHEKMDRG
jgi:ferredoxin